MTDRSDSSEGVRPDASESTPTVWESHVEMLRQRAVPTDYALRYRAHSADLGKIRATCERTKTKSPYPGLPLVPTTGFVVPHPESGEPPYGRFRADRTRVFIPGPEPGQEDVGAKEMKIPRWFGPKGRVMPFVTFEARQVAGDVSVPIAIVEASIKAMSVAANGVMAAIGLCGVLAGAHDKGALDELAEVVIHPLLRTIKWHGRKVYVIFDAGITSNAFVALGAAYVSVALRREGADVHLVILDPLQHFHVQDADIEKGVLYSETDCGPDDFIFRNGAEALKTLIGETALLANPVDRAQAILDTKKRAERPAAFAALLAELPVKAMLYADPEIATAVAGIAKVGEYPTKAIKAAVASFKDALARRATKDHPKEARPAVAISTNHKVVNDAVIAALAASDRDLYQRDGSLVAVTKEPAPPKNAAKLTIARAPGSPKIVVVPPPGLRERITEHVVLTRETSEGSVPAHPPEWMAPEIHCRGGWDGVRTLVGITETPTLRLDGTILQTAGYDSATGLLYVPSITFPEIPDSPTKVDAEDALKDLRSILEDYQFATPENEAAAIGAFMTPVVRPGIAGPVPVWIIDGVRAGVGKGLLADCGALIATGRKATVFTYTDDETEQKKSLLSFVIAGDRIILIDDTNRFGSRVFSAFLTSFPEYGERILGFSANHKGPQLAFLTITGNNIEARHDAAERALYSRLTTTHEDPRSRPSSDFAHGDLRAYVAANRARFVTDILIIVRAYLAADTPPVQGGVWGSFEAWAEVVARPLIWLGMADPCRARAAWAETPTSPTAKLGTLLSSWERAYGDGSRTARDVVLDMIAESKKEHDDADVDVLALKDAILSFCCCKGSDLPSSGSLGSRLALIRGTVVGGLRLVEEGKRDNTALWKTERAEAPASAVSPALDEDVDEETKALRDQV